MTFAGPARSCAGQRVANLSRSSCSWATHRFRRRNDTWAPNRTWFTLQTTRSNCEWLSKVKFVPPPRSFPPPPLNPPPPPPRRPHPSYARRPPGANLPPPPPAFSFVLIGALLPNFLPPPPPPPPPCDAKDLPHFLDTVVRSVSAVGSSIPNLRCIDWFNTSFSRWKSYRSFRCFGTILEPLNNELVRRNLPPRESLTTNRKRLRWPSLVPAICSRQ